MPVILKNNAFSTLATGITASDTGIVVASGSAFPALSAGEYFYVTLVSQAGTTEIIKVTARVGNSMTVVRAQDGSTAASFQAGTLVEMRVNVASIAELRDEAVEISIADAGGFYTSGTVEGALQETAVNTLTRNTVPALLADTALTYSNVTAGYVICTRTESYAYEVAASGASDHDVTTAGGVKLYVLPTADNQVNIHQFGAVGLDSAEDTAAFVAFRVWALRQGGAVTLNLDRAKTYLVANPYWPRDILSLTVNGNGSTIKNSATVNVDKSLLNPSYGTDADGLGTFYTPVSRYALNTTTIGATSATTSTAANAGNFAAGEWVMIASFDLQFEGQPPNYRFFEYHQVANVNAGTGVVTFKDRVKYAHQSDFPYRVNPNSDGRAHIYKIEQGAKWGIDHTYNDITFALNDVSSGLATTEAVYCTGLKLTFNRCVAPYFLPTAAGTIILNDCAQVGTGSTEFDKLVEVLELNNCAFESRVDSATSVGSVIARSTTFSGGYKLCPKRLTLIDCSVQAASGSDVGIFETYGFVDELSIQGGTHQFLPSLTIVDTQVRKLVIGSGGVTWDAGARSLTVPLNFLANRLFSSFLFPGSIICVTDLYSGSQYSVGNFGVVRSVSGSADLAVAVIDWDVAPAGSETITVFAEPRMTNINTRAVKRSYARIASGLYKRDNLLLTSGFSQENIAVMGRPTRVVVDVKRPYTGATGGNTTLQIVNIFPSFAGRLSLFVDLKTAGRRERTMSANGGWTGTGGESVAGNLSAARSRDVSFGNIGFFASTMATTTNQELPLVDVLVEFEQPLLK